MLNNQQSLLTYLGKQSRNHTILVGFADNTPEFALAAGLRNANDDERFTVLGRYLLNQRFKLNAYWLILPAQIDNTAVQVIDINHRIKTRKHWQVLGNNDITAIDTSNQLTTLFPDLLVPGKNLPGIMRRELDQLFDTCEIDPPV